MSFRNLYIFANNADKNWQRSMSRKKNVGARDGSGSLVFFWHCERCTYILFRFVSTVPLFYAFPFFIAWRLFLCACVLQLLWIQFYVSKYAYTAWEALTHIHTQAHKYKSQKKAAAALPPPLSSSVAKKYMCIKLRVPSHSNLFI